jgi:hypothetical protein
MSLPSLVLLMSLSSAAPGTAAPTGSIERIVVVLGERDPVSASRVVRQLKSCTDGTPTAVVSYFGKLRVEQDFTTESDAISAAISRGAAPRDGSPVPKAGSFSLAASVPPERIGSARSLAASLELLAEALAPVGPTTAIVLVSPQIGADSGMAVYSPVQPRVEGEETSTGLGYDTVAIPQPVLEARKTLRKTGLTVVAVNTNGVYDAGAKALTEIPGGRYIQSSQRDFGKALVSAVCGPGR